MLVEVSKERVTITQGGHVNAGEMNVNTCTFFLPECFEGLNVTACFNGIPVPIVKNNCTIPALKQGTAILGVYAYKENDDGLELIYSPEPTCFCVHNGSFTEDFEQELTFEISEYEQYCNMLKSEYEKTEALFSSAEEERREAETLRANAEGMRQSEFATNEAQRQAAFELNEQKREASFGGAYTNLLENAIADSTTANPTQLPAHKINVLFQQLEVYEFITKNGFECYIFEAHQGDRFNMSGFSISSASSQVASIAIVDSAFGVIDNFNTALLASKFACGLYACPENTAYVIVNKAIDGLMPVITRVEEPVCTPIDCSVSGATKCIAPLYNATTHATYFGTVGNALSHSWKAESVTYYSSGIYPLEEGKEYVLYVPESTVFTVLGCICNENFIVGSVIKDENLNSKRRIVFTANENEKYIALNCYDFNTIQFGENKCNKIKAGANIGKGFFDGAHDVSLEEMGVIDRNLSDKKWVSFGDSITRGVGVDFVNGEKRWQNYVVERYNIGTHVEMGEGYTSLAHKNGEVEECYCHDSRLNALINESPDIVTILGGANDYIFNIPIGTDVDVENKNIETFKGAYAYIIDRILTAKPDTIIILMGMFHNAMGAYGEGKGAYPLMDYGVATKEVAECFGLPFVDLNDCGFNKYNFNTTDGVFSTDGIHPNKEGAKRIAMVVSKWFDTFKGTAF